MVKHYYFYCVDKKFEAFCIKFCSFLSLHGQALHQRARVSQRATRQGRHRIRSARRRGLCVVRTRAAAQGIAEALEIKKRVERFSRKWLSVLPQPYRDRRSRKAGFRYRLSVLQAELSLTRLQYRLRHGREFFEEVVRENMDFGPNAERSSGSSRGESSHLKFAGGGCRTRIVTDGVIPSLHVYYKNAHLKQYHRRGGRGRACYRNRRKH